MLIGQSNGTHQATQDLLRGILFVCMVGTLGLLLAVLPLPVAATVVLGPAVLLAVLIRPLVGLALVIVAVPFGAPFNIQLGGAVIGEGQGINFGPMELLFALTAAAWVGNTIVAGDLPNSGARSQRSGTPWVIWPVVLFILFQLLTIAQTHSLAASLKEVVKWCEVLVVVVLVTRVLDLQHAPLIVLLIFAAAVLEAAIGLFQTITGQGPAPFMVSLGGRQLARSYGNFEQPNPFAAYLNLSLPLASSLVLYALFNRRAGTTAPVPPGIAAFLGPAAALTLPIVGAALFFSLSRGAWLGFAAALAMITAVRSRRASVALAVTLFLFLALVALGSLNILPPAIGERIVEIPAFFGLNLFDPRAVVLTDENFAIVDRMAHWFAAWNMFADYPWLGVGIGNYPVVYDRYALPEWPASLGHAHNIYLNLLAEAGLFGLAGYVLLVASGLVLAWQVLSQKTGWQRALATGILGAIVAIAVHNFFDNVHVHGMYIQFGVMLGLLGRMQAEER